MNKLFKVSVIGLLSITLISGGLLGFRLYSKASDDVVNDNQAVSQNEVSQEGLKDLDLESRKFINLLYDMKFDAVRNMMTDDMKADCTDDFFIKLMNESMYKDDFVEVKDVQINVGQDGYYCILDIQEKYRTKRIKIVYNLDKKICGFFLINTFAPVPEENDFFREESIQVGSLDGYKLDGLLTLPKNREKAPVVILVHGSGYHNADESIGGNRGFAQIAHGLAKHGIATVRYNERFHQYPELSYSNNTVYTEVIDDACAIVDQMSNDSRIDSSNIYIVGHSLGGMCAPKIAELNSKVAGIVSLAGSPRSLVDISMDQRLLALDEYELSDEEKSMYKEIILSEIDIIRNITKGSDEIVGGYSENYWYSHNMLNVENSLKALDVPMLILQGEEDIQVYADKDYKEWQRILQGRDNCEFKLYEGLNHSFTKSKGYPISQINEEYVIIDNVDERVINDIAVFINKRGVSIEKN